MIIFFVLCQTQPSWKQFDVFQLDPLEGDDAPDIPDTVRQHAVSDILLGVIQDVLNGPELNPVLRPVLGNFLMEITRVLLTLKFCSVTSKNV